ncbi:MULTISPECIES: hypothetical protein [Stappiaceae]|jgi:hypothetical protein|nr:MULTISPECIES: hypothetical protein [Stappiaceae]
MHSLIDATAEGKQLSAIRLRVLSLSIVVPKTTLALVAVHGAVG